MLPVKARADKVVTFHRVSPAALPPLRADKAALGTMPTAAFQYCEAMRAASSFGWYVFPAQDIQLMWDGVDVFHAVEGQWTRLSSVTLGDEFTEYWDAHAPDDLKGCSPPFLSSLFVPGIVQIWSGLFVSTADQWSLLIGPPANMAQSRGYACYEGIVETDTFRPCPLFVNIRLQTTDKEIHIPRNKPLFQVRPIRQECYADAVFDHHEIDGLAAPSPDADGMSEEDWSGYRTTVRRVDQPDTRRAPGAYGASRRRRQKQGG